MSMLIDAEMKSPESKLFHGLLKNAIRMTMRFVKIPQEWLLTPDFDADQNAKVLRKHLVEYTRYEDRRDSRYEMLVELFRFFVLLYHTDPFYRERIGWFLWAVHDDIEAGQFGYERLFMVDKEGKPVDGFVGYDPEDWWGAPAGRGWDSEEKKTWYKLTDEEVELSAQLWRVRQKQEYERLVKEGLIPQKINTEK